MQPDPTPLFTKEDWTSFRTLATLGQKAGVPEGWIPSLVAKELVDNALDEAGSCRIEPIDGDGFRVTDEGGGIPGDDAAVASLFSITRPMTSSKLIRRPTRGALGNGLRVVTGAVVSTRGTLLVSTRGRTLNLIHDHDTGATIAQNIGPWDQAGTQVEVSFGGRFPIDEGTLEWALMAIRLAGTKRYEGKTSALWYSVDAFYELLQAARGRTLRDLIASFEGYSDRSSGPVVASHGHDGKKCRELSRAEAGTLLAALQKSSMPVPPGKLGSVGPVEGFENHAVFTDYVQVGLISLPVSVEAWTQPIEEDFYIHVFVNRTPITGEIEIIKSYDKNIYIRGCGCYGHFGGNHGPFDLWFNVDTPYMPITTDGKAPDFGPFRELILKTVQKAAKKIPREKALPRIRYMTQKDLIFDLIPSAASHASGNGQYRFSQRQLFYRIRPDFIDSFGAPPGYGYFCSVVTDYENAFGEIPGMYRDVRGVVYHPHTQDRIPLGDLNVENYNRPDWLFNKVLYIEKEGFFNILTDEKWPERHDCALMTSKGQGTRAAKDLIDYLGETEEPCEFFIIHDADAAGTMIYQSLQEETAARGARNVKIINLGLEPREGRAMDLQVEEVKYKNHPAIADYVPPSDQIWLQDKRIELDAMTTPQFLRWINAKFESYSKLIPPAQVMRERLEEKIRERLEERIRDEILEEADFTGQVDAAFEDLGPEIDEKAETLVDEVTAELMQDRARPWRSPVDQIADELALMTAPLENPMR
jgi:hypothetical protein